MKKIIAVLVFILFLISGCSNSKKDSDTAQAQKIIDYHKKKFESLPLSGNLINGRREIEVKAYQYRWDPDTIVVKKGEKIKMTVEAVDVPHGFEIEGVQIPGLNIDEPIKKNEKRTVEFTANEAGSWDLVCTTYCGPGHAGMKGKYVVKE